MKIMDSAQKSRAVRLIKAECANYCGGECILADTACFQAHSYSLLCVPFQNYVLPLDMELQADIFGAGERKICAICKKPIWAKSNRQKYCDECRTHVRRQKERDRQRHNYATRQQGVKPLHLDRQNLL